MREFVRFSSTCSGWCYGVASISRIDKIIGLFCKRALQKRQYSAKETYNFIDPTDRSHPICDMTHSVCDMTHFMCDMTHSKCDMARLKRTTICDMTHSMCDMAHSDSVHMWHDSFRLIAKPSHDYPTHFIRDKTHSIRDMTHSAHDMTHSTRAMTHSVAVLTRLESNIITKLLHSFHLWHDSLYTWHDSFHKWDDSLHTCHNSHRLAVLTRLESKTITKLLAALSSLPWLALVVLPMTLGVPFPYEWYAAVNSLWVFVGVCRGSLSFSCL